MYKLDNWPIAQCNVIRCMLKTEKCVWWDVKPYSINYSENFTLNNNKPNSVAAVTGNVCFLVHDFWYHQRYQKSSMFRDTITPICPVTLSFITMTVVPDAHLDIIKMNLCNTN